MRPSVELRQRKLSILSQSTPVLLVILIFPFILTRIRDFQAIYIQFTIFLLTSIKKFFYHYSSIMFVKALILTSLLVGVVHAQCDPTQTLQDIHGDCAMKELKAEDGRIDLFLMPMTYRGVEGFEMTTRAYAGPDQIPSLPGPVIRVKSGTEVKLRLHNSLGKDQLPAAEGQINGYFEANTTNLHLHVSEKRMILCFVFPGLCLLIMFSLCRFYRACT